MESPYLAISKRVLAAQDTDVHIGPRRLVELCMLACPDIKALPVDDHLVGMLVDIGLGAALADSRIAARHNAPLRCGMRKARPHKTRQTNRCTNQKTVFK